MAHPDRTLLARPQKSTYNFGVFFKYIQPCSPVTAKTVPAGDDWRHEIKFDGFRVQAHIIGKMVQLYSRSGGQFSRRFPRLVEVLGELPTRSAIIDGEIVASDVVGMPDFWPLFLRSAKPAELHVWALRLSKCDGASTAQMLILPSPGKLFESEEMLRCRPK